MHTFYPWTQNPTIVKVIVSGKVTIEAPTPKNNVHPSDEKLTNNKVIPYHVRNTLGSHSHSIFSSRNKASCNYSCYSSQNKSK